MSWCSNTMMNYDLYACVKIYNDYIAVIQRYWPAQPSVFSHILIMSAKNNVLFFNSSIMYLLCSAVVLESSLMSSDIFKNTTLRDTWYNSKNRMRCCDTLNCFKDVVSIDTDLLPPYYYYFIWWEKLNTNRSALSRCHETSCKFPNCLNASQRSFPQWWVTRIFTCGKLNASFCIAGM